MVCGELQEKRQGPNTIPYGVAAGAARRAGDPRLLRSVLPFSGGFSPPTSGILVSTASTSSSPSSHRTKIDCEWRSLIAKCF